MGRPLIGLSSAAALANAAYAMCRAPVLPLFAALSTDLSDSSRYGAAHGLFGTIFDVGDAFGPIAGGLVAARLGYEATFQLAAAGVIVLALLFGLLSRTWTTPAFQYPRA